ncbi:MAG: CoB--CoM heterodisulfide reductase iron-sulfur subunit B family protein [Desulfovibrionaceae bacterium]
MKFAYYPGCSGLGTSREYDRSARAVCAALGVDLAEIPDWSCCGSTPAHALENVLSAALSARNLHLAARMGCDAVTTPCPSCLSNLKTARHHMADTAFSERVSRLLGEPGAALSALPEVRSVLQVLVEDLGLDAVRERVRRPLSGLRLAPYYGCIMNRPADIMRFDDPENPTSLDRLLEALGAEVVPFPFKVECCGASYGMARRDIVGRLAGRILGAAREAGAHALAVACPLCQLNLDLRQPQATPRNGNGSDMPVIYFTQLAGLALGLPEGELGFEQLCVDPGPLLRRHVRSLTECTGARPCG